jgi:MFS family permease
MTSTAQSGRNTTVLIAAAAAVMLITTGARQVSGLFVLPIIDSTGMSIASVSFALAIGQFMWGAMQPVFGALADSYGAYRILIIGALLLAAGSVLTTFVHSEMTLIATMGVLSAAGAAAGSFSILIGGTARRLSASQRSTAAGTINAGGSLGQFVFAPIVQTVIGAWGWAAAMFTLAAAALTTIPLGLPLRNKHSPAQPSAQSSGDIDARLSGASSTAQGSVSASDAAPATPAPEITLGQQVRAALRDRNYVYLNLGFFTCGFHVAFLVTHFPGEIALCGLTPNVAANSLALIGLFNVAGSVGAGILGQRYRMKHLLALIYGSRAAMIAIYLLMPKTAFNVYLFAAGMGMTWLATVPPTSGIVGKLYGVRYLGTLFGLTLVSHQIGAFLGAWLGGLAMAKYHSFQWIWFADMALAVAAALINLPIREDRPLPRPAVAA